MLKRLFLCGALFASCAYAQIDTDALNDVIKQRGWTDQHAFIDKDVKNPLLDRDVFKKVWTGSGKHKLPTQMELVTDLVAFSPEIRDLTRVSLAAFDFYVRALSGKVPWIKLTNKSAGETPGLLGEMADAIGQAGTLLGLTELNNDLGRVAWVNELYKAPNGASELLKNHYKNTLDLIHVGIQLGHSPEKMNITNLDSVFKKLIENPFFQDNVDKFKKVEDVNVISQWLGIAPYLPEWGKDYSSPNTLKSPLFYLISGYWKSDAKQPPACEVIKYWKGRRSLDDFIILNESAFWYGAADTSNDAAIFRQKKMLGLNLFLVAFEIYINRLERLNFLNDDQKQYLKKIDKNPVINSWEDFYKTMSKVKKDIFGENVKIIFQ